MKKILAFCFFPAFVPATNGGQSRLFNFYKALSRYHEVTLLTSTHFGINEEKIYHGFNFIERRIPKDEFFIQQYNELKKFSAGGDLSGPAIAASGKHPTLLHKAYLEEYVESEIIIHDFPFTANYDLFAGIDCKPRIYNAHNCESILYRQLHDDNKSQPIHDIVHRSEKHMLSNSDLVLYCNDADLALFRDMAPDAQFEALYAPNGMTPIELMKQFTDSISRTFRTVFMGSSHPPNVEAAKFIVRTLAPKFPGVIFDIIGSCLPEGRYPNNVKRHGLVDDKTKRNILLCADVALNPMKSGSGSNVKVLEYFAYSIPVLSTSFGMRGIRAIADIDYVESTIEQFDQMLEQVINDKKLLSDVAIAGNNLALENYTWEAIVKPVTQRLEAGFTKKIGSNYDRRFVLVLNDYDSFSTIGGGSSRTRNIYEAVQAWSPVVFLSFSEDDRLNVRLHDEKLFVINIPKSFEHISDIARTNSRFNVSANDIIAGRHSKSNVWLNAIYSILRNSARCVIVEHCYMVEVPISYGDRFIYSSQNNETDLKRSILAKHPFAKELLLSVQYFEKLAVENSAATIAVSIEDAESLVKGKRTAGPIIVVRNGASVPVTDGDVDQNLKSLCEKVKNRAVVFVGSAHMPNVESAIYIVNQIAPNCPDVFFHLIGSVCNSISKVPNNVYLWGVLDEVAKNAVMSSCKIALNPMITGGGSNVKLADYIGNGLFVLTTEFGQRGYPESIKDHIKIVHLEGFTKAINEVIAESGFFTEESKKLRRELFARELSMKGIAEKFIDNLKNLEKQKRRVLYVAYRYTYPSLGGAEANIEKFVRALGNSGEFDVDVVSPAISGIHNYLRFNENYTFDPDMGVPVDIPNVRYARFESEKPCLQVIKTHLQKAWSTQPQFEKEVNRAICDYYTEHGLTWGWSYFEGVDNIGARWTFTDCGIYLCKAANVYLEGYAYHDVVIVVYNDKEKVIAGPFSLKGKFSLTFRNNKSGDIRLETSAPMIRSEPRALSVRISRVKVDNSEINLSLSTLIEKYLAKLPADRIFRLLDNASQKTRGVKKISLTDGRGPWSRSLEQFIAKHVSEYDLVVTHNNIFRPAVVAIKEAKKHGVPSILIPHAHFDDDFYHFPDLLESVIDANLVLAVPKAACKFLAEKGCNVDYLPAGCNAYEEFIPQDEAAFSQIFRLNKPFVLVLGRKSGAKGYREVIKAVEQLNLKGTEIHAVLIGPDDDGLPVNSPYATYLGLQSREVVRGALMSCVALCNMSASESFGIVLLEAWLANKPVIVNKNCVAFHDMAIHEVNALMVDADSLADAINTLMSQPELRDKLATNGKKLLHEFDWEVICRKFINKCNEMVCNN